MTIAADQTDPRHGDSLAAHYESVRAHSLALAAPLSPEDCQIQSMPDASPVKWHLGHTNWFFETVILAPRPGYRPFDPRFAYLFNSYYEALGPRHPRPRRGLITRPALDDVLAWRAHVDAAMAGVLDEPALRDAVLLGLHHEQQHQELILTDIKHAFFANPLLPAYSGASLWPQAGSRSRKTALRPSAPASPSDAGGKSQSPLQWLEHSGGVVQIGHAGGGFAFDNETPRHDVLLRPFRIAARPVSNGEYRAFIADGGYRRPEFWLSDGWAMVEQERWEAPLYWLKDDDGTESVFTLSGVRALDPHAPLEHVSFFEAAAYAAWAGKRLPTEFEWEAMSGRFAQGQVWEWTRSSYDPYPGFRPFEGVAAEYNGKFMVGQLVLRGGSVATPPGHMRRTYRNFFPASARWQFSGIRLAEDA